jgi:cytochrome P450 family 110
MKLTHHPVWPTRRHALPPSLPFPALVHTMIGRACPYAYAEMNRARYGNCFTVNLVDMSPLVFLSDPHDIRVIVTADPDDLHSGEGGALFTPLFGDSAFVLHDKDQHDSVRSAIMPAFANTIVQRHASAVADIVARETALWPIGSAFSLMPYLDRLTLKVILMTVIAAESAMHDTLCQSMLAMLSVMATPLLQEPRLRHLPGWRKTWNRFLRQRHEVDQLIYALIAQRRQQKDSKDDLLGVLLATHNQDGSPMSDAQIRDNLVAIIIAGHETTAMTLAWTFQLLAHYPDVQARLVEEIGSATDGPYMSAVIQEALRHKSTFLFLPPRVVLRPTEIGGWNFEPPVQLLACIYLMHHDREFYPDPHVFFPERFLNQSQAPPPGTLLPWGAGRKRCPGRHLALMEIRTVLARVLSAFQVFPASARIERPRWRTALLMPHDGSKVILRRHHHTRTPGTVINNLASNQHRGSI